MRVTLQQAEEFDKANKEQKKQNAHKPFIFNPLDFEADIPERVAPQNYILKDTEEELHKPRIVSHNGYGLCDIPEDCPAKVLEYGNMIEIITSSNNSTGDALKRFRKISADEYIDTETGEIKKYKKNEHRMQPMTTAQFNSSLRDLKRLILGNFSDKQGLFITLGYDHYMPDYTVAQKDYTKFYDRLRYYCKTHLKIDKLLYIKVVEPKASGSWHFHILLKSSEGEPLNITEEWVRDKWGQQSVSVKPITNVKGLAVYLTKSTDTSKIGKHSYSDDNDIDEITIMTDKYEPQRRKCYKSHMKLYSASKELKRPVISRMSQEDAREKIKGYHLKNKRYSIVRYRCRAKELRILNVTNYETYEKE